jgi:hypothetical protein
MLDGMAFECLLKAVWVKRGRERLVETRTDVTRGWNAMAELLETQGHRELASVVRRFVDRMPPPQTERQWIGRELQERVVRARELERGHGR